jgi:uncharacterized protein YjbJ (UPF0337 family)
MSAVDKVKNKAQEVRGAVKQTTGDVTGDRSLRAKGSAERTAGNAKQAGEKVKDALR